MSENLWNSDSSQSAEFEHNNPLEELKEYLSTPTALESINSVSEVCKKCGSNKWKLLYRHDVDFFVMKCAQCSDELVFQCFK